MRILFVGGTQFIGPPAVHAMLAAGHTVAVFHRGQTQGDLPEEVQHLHGDRNDLKDHRTAFRSYAPEVVVDMRAMNEGDGVRTSEVFMGIARRLVVISSVDVYRAFDRFRGADPGPPDPTPLTEESPLRDQLFPYRQRAKGPDDQLFIYDKILMERAVMAAGNDLPATVLRLPMVYGPGDYQHRLFPYLRRMDDHRPAIMLPRSQQSWHGLRGYVEDIGAAILRCVEDDRAAGRIYHIADERPLTEQQWVARIAQAAGWTGRVTMVPDERLPAHLMPEFNAAQDLAIDSSRIRSEIGYREQIDAAEAMRRTVAWERAHQPAAVEAAHFDYGAEDAVLATLASL
ncbi:MAG: SDR family oxidoreductase [Herpetosiphon sp.]